MGRETDAVAFFAALAEAPYRYDFYQTLRTSGHTRHVREPDHPSCRRTWSEHRDKAGRPRATLQPTPREVMPLR